ncbi:type II secretion system protein GspD [Novosphingobium album (ex Liu et al. 2023)]|uniref:Type II/III secretion system secretin-like domain-containing protein n=1 Tax=Novosphingobium album (ex Liu et al. 2023) TaxID=3031130 RepID=A0ABT5WPB9_9SPHN|nr:hypothetical protein [Novosphingobium album (ex Liu et al. 2023)]MDE8651895.1 hypothetical protein [Novosphingobium album (ex Liu et al. 2023)]
MPEGSGPVRVQLDSMPTGALVTMLMRDVLGVPYVIAPDVLTDRKALSVNLVMPRDDLPVAIARFLRSIGLVVDLQGGTVFVSRKPMSGALYPSPSMPSSAPVNFGGSPTGSPLLPSSPSSPAVTAVADEPLPVVAVIEPAHRSPMELAEVVRSVLPSVSVAAREASEPRGGQVADRFAPSSLVLSGRKADVSLAMELIRSIDRPRPSVSIRAVLFEVRTSRSRGSALSLLADVLGGRISLSSFAGQAGGDQFLKIATGGLSAVVSAVRGDGRFEVVAEPSLSAVSGSTATINSGSQVPTIGEVTYTDNGQPVRSVVYRDSGVSLTVSPTVRKGEIELRVTQERSSFVRTSTGVDETPTLNKSSASSVVAMLPGETVAIAGLDERSDENNRQGLFGGLLGSRRHDKMASQLLLLVQADIVRDDRGATTGVQLLGEDNDDETASDVSPEPRVGV